MIVDSDEETPQTKDQRYSIRSALCDEQWKQKCSRYQQISQLINEKIKYYISFAWVKTGWLSLAERCLLIVIQAPNQKSMIGFATQIQIQGFPFKDSPILNAKQFVTSSLKSYKLGDSSLKMTLIEREKQKPQQYLFSFDKVQLSRQWTNLFIRIEEEQNQENKMMLIQKQHHKISSELNNKITVLTRQIQLVQDENKSYQQQIKDMKEAHRKEVQGFREKFNKAQVQYKQLDKKYEIILPELLAIQQKQRRLLSAKAQRQKQISNLIEQNKMLKRQKEQSFRQNQQYLTKISALQQIIAQHERLQHKNKQQNSQLTARFTQLQQKLNQAQRQILERDQQIAKITEQKQKELATL